MRSFNPGGKSRFCFQSLVAHHCCDPCRATQCRAHSVAANFRSFRNVAGVSRYTLQPSQKKTLSHPSCHPLSVSQRNILAKRIALHGGVAATLTPVALHCATKFQSLVPPGSQSVTEFFQACSGKPFLTISSLATSLAFYRSQKGLSPEKGFPGPRKTQRSRKRVENELKT